jgi:tetratricopeptide (TPR) repeat protein
MSFAEQTFARALELHKAGRPNEAAPLYRQILAVDPKHVDSLHLLGVAAYDAGRYDEAFDPIGKAIALNDRVADFHCNMGLVLLALGRRDEAVAHYGQAISIEPRHALSYNNLGNLLADMGCTEEGIAHLTHAVEFKPDYPEAHYNLANALATQGKLDDAVAHYRRAVALAPNFINAHNNLGTVLDRQGKSDEAEAQYRRVLALEPHNARAHYNIGNLCRDKTDHDAAIAHYKRAIAGAPDFADAWNNLGALLAECGDLVAAREAYEKAVAAGPTRAAYHRNLANSKRFTPGDSQLASMEQLIRDIDSVPEAERIDLQFALGKAYADLKQHDRSFQHLLLGNSLKRARFVYDEGEALAYMQRMRTAFDDTLFAEKTGGGERAVTPVFVVGMPRSGTTLVEQIIASHPRATGAGELFYLDQIVHSLMGHDRSGALHYPEVVGTMSDEQFRLVGVTYVSAIRALAPLALRIVDKMPWNFHHLGLIRLALPNARIIHTRRDPADTCLSCYSILFNGDDNKYTYDLRELGRFYRAYDALMAHWRAVLPPGFMLEVQYEEVVEDLGKQARRIISHCGLEWDDACLSFHETRRPVRTSSLAQVRQPIYRSSVGRWLPYREGLRPLLEELGIDPDVDWIQEPPVPMPTLLPAAEGARGG